jgi:hypothetical protein
MSSRHDVHHASQGCHVSSILNFVIGGLVLAGLGAAAYFVLVR